MQEPLTREEFAWALKCVQVFVYTCVYVSMCIHAYIQASVRTCAAASYMHAYLHACLPKHHQSVHLHVLFSGSVPTYTVFVVYNCDMDLYGQRDRRRAGIC
jgi:hypothetical protein